MTEATVAADQHRSTHADILRIPRVPQQGGTMRSMNALAATVAAESPTPTPTDRDVERHEGFMSSDMDVLPSGRSWYAADEPSHIHIPRPSRRARTVAAGASAVDG